MDTEQLAALDREVLWHPFTQMQGWQEEPPILIYGAQGTTLVDTEGRRYIDGVSSLWCNVHGHGHPHIDAAVREQLDRVAHTTMLGLSHPPAVELARKLLDVAPDGLSRVFSSDNGSHPPAHRPGRAVAGLLLRQRLDRRRDRAEDGVPVLAAPRRPRAHRVRLPAQQLPRRHDRLGLRRGPRPLPSPLPAAAVRGLLRRARRRAGTVGPARRAPRPDRRGD